jgi:hypothetical protein
MLKKVLSGLGFIAVLIAMAIGGQIGKEVGKTAFTPSKPSQKEIDAVLIEGFEKAAKQVNATTPTMIDEDTRMDKATVGPGARVTYHYTFPKYSSRDVDSEWIISNLRPVVKSNVCASEEMKPSLQYGGVYSFSYSGSDGVHIASFQLDRNDCGFPKITP